MERGGLHEASVVPYEAAAALYRCSSSGITACSWCTSAGARRPARPHGTQWPTDIAGRGGRS
jgi:hypothetical protein